MQADSGYKFDFIPSPLPVSPPTIFSSTIAGTSTPSVGGIYTGSVNENYTMTIMNIAIVGTDAFNVDVTNAAGTTTVNVPAGYIPGDPIAVGDGIEISFSGGAGETVVNGDTFDTAALISSPDASHSCRRR